MDSQPKRRKSVQRFADPAADLSVEEGLNLGTHRPEIADRVGSVDSTSELLDRAFELADAKRKKPVAATAGRFEALDLARGIAVTLMILSHGVKGLLTFEQIPAWGLVPIHLVTKFSSSLFLLVFGATLALSFVPAIGTPEWPKKRLKLMVRGLTVLFWYKALTILEMSHLYTTQEIWSTLKYEGFPVYVEILGFYALFLMWIPWFLPIWKSSPAVVRVLYPLLFLMASIFLGRHFGFFGSDIFQAMMVEHPNYYAWGQLARAPLVFTGLLIGWMIQSSAGRKWPRLLPFAVLAGTSFALFAGYLSQAGPQLQESLVQIAKNAGKHPPELQFMLFSLGGAFLIMALAVGGGKTLSHVLSPLTLIGKNSLQSFIFHIVVLFVFYRFLYGYMHKIEYGHALFLAVLMVVLTPVWLIVKDWVRKNS